MKNKSIDIYFFGGTGSIYLSAKKIVEIFHKDE